MKDAQDSQTTSRDRRKLKLKAEIRRQAYRLFNEQGYAKTSVEQIAAASDISYSTFFRYFPNKQTIAGDLRFDGLFIETLESQPHDISLSMAILNTAKALPDLLTPQDLAEMREHYVLLMKIPELQATGFAYLSMTTKLLAKTITDRLSAKNQNELAIQALAWSIVGGWVAGFHYWIAHPESELPSVIYEALQGAVGGAKQLTEEVSM